MKIQGRTFIVSGGGSGLGAATARVLVGAGGNVVLADINAETGQQMSAELGEQARFAKTDVTSEADVQQAIDLARSEFGSLSGAINCAGIVIGEKVVSSKGVHDLGHFTTVIQINLIGTFNVIRLTAAAMSENDPDEMGERGIIINTASVAAFDGQMGQVAYSASKGGIVAMTLPLARDLARSGIRVMAIAPGIFDTPMLAGLPEDVRLSLGKQVPFPSRLGQPSEYAALARHIIENPMLNGEVIRLDGAIRMTPK